MANLNQVNLIGRLTRDPDIKQFGNGGKGAFFGFVVNNRIFNSTSQAWDQKPVWIDCKCFDREKGRKLASLVEQYLKKGSQVFLQGHLDLETWDDKNGGGKRQALRVIVDDMQFLDAKQDSAPRTAPSPSAPTQSAASPTASSTASSTGRNAPVPFDEFDPNYGQGRPSHYNDDDIPF